MAKIPTIASFIFRKMDGRPHVYPKRKLPYVENLLHMMFSTPTEPYEPHPEEIKALDLMLLLHADHEQNCSTSTVRLVGSAETNLFASIAAGMCALWGPLHARLNPRLGNAVVKSAPLFFPENLSVKRQSLCFTLRKNWRPPFGRERRFTRL